MATKIKGKGLWLTANRTSRDISVRIAPNPEDPETLILFIEEEPYDRAVPHDWIVIRKEVADIFNDPKKTLRIVFFSGDLVQEEIALGDGVELLDRFDDGCNYTVLIFAVEDLKGSTSGNAVFYTSDKRIFRLTELFENPQCEIPEIREGIIYNLTPDGGYAEIFEFDLTGELPFVLQGTDDDATARLIEFNLGTKALLRSPDSRLILVRSSDDLLFADEDGSMSRDNAEDEPCCGRTVFFGDAISLVGINEANSARCECIHVDNHGCCRLATMVAFVVDDVNAPQPDRQLAIDTWHCGDFATYVIKHVGTAVPDIKVTKDLAIEAPNEDDIPIDEDPDGTPDLITIGKRQIGCTG